MNRKLEICSIGVILALMTLTTPRTASANTILTYTGNTYGQVTDPYTTSMRVTTQIELLTDLGLNCTNCDVTPVGFSMNDGRITLTNASPGVASLFRFSTDGTGTITSWTVQAQISGPEFIAFIQSNRSQPFSSADTAYLQDADGTHVGQSSVPGVWTSQHTAVPEPASLGLLAIGLAGLGLRLRKKPS